MRTYKKKLLVWLLVEVIVLLFENLDFWINLDKTLI